MRLPVKSEAEAFRIVYGLALVVGCALLVGYLLGELEGIALLILATAAALAWGLASAKPERHASLHEAEREGHEHGGDNAHRVLVVANEAVAGDAVWGQLLARAGSPPVVEVLSPVLQSRTHFVTTDIDRETEAARRRLEETINSAERHGLRATGEVGDPIDPLEALADELRRYDVDEVIVATHGAERMNWLETDMLARIREQVDSPLTHLVIERGTR